MSSEIWAKIIHVSSEQSIQELVYGDFPEGPVVKTSPSNAKGEGSVPDWEAKTLHASSPKTQSVKQKQYCNKFSKDFKNGPHPKKFLKKKKKIRSDLKKKKLMSWYMALYSPFTSC